jgi:glycosyltransferase involved in cell wall biosynthesis
VAYGGIPIDTDHITPHHPDAEPEKVRFFIGIQRDRTVVKGTDRLLAAVQAVHAKYADLCEVEVVESVPYNEYLSRMSHSHVILDQLYSYTPATNALLGMAHGLVAVSGAEPEYYQLIGETENHPIVNVSPLVEGDIEAKLEWIIKNKSQLPALSRASRAFVEKHNAARTVASRYLAFWEKL